MCLDCLLFGHTYNIVDSHNFYVNDWDKKPYGIIYVYKCIKCNKIKVSKPMKILK